MRKVGGREANPYQAPRIGTVALVGTPMSWARYAIDAKDNSVVGFSRRIPSLLTYPGKRKTVCS
jgi:hypothetical protein